MNLSDNFYLTKSNFETKVNIFNNEKERKQAHIKARKY